MQIKLRIYLLLVALLCFLFNLMFHLNINTQISFLILVLIIFGVPHGALDLYIDQHLQKTAHNQKVFLVKYVANIVCYAMIWYFLPITALVIFIVITAFHFGEIDWMGKTNRPIHKIVYTFLGFSWILFLLSKNVNFAIDIFLKMGRSSFNTNQLISFASIIYPISLASITVIYAGLCFFKDQFFFKKTHYYFALMQTSILILFTLYMPLWICFAFYFGFWHSLLSFDKIRVAFNIENTLKGWKSLLSKAAPFSIVAWFGFAYITFLTLNSKDASGIFTLLFISLSVLALPHLQVFTKLKLNPDL